MHPRFPAFLVLIFGCSSVPIAPPSVPAASSAASPSPSTPEELQGPVAAPTPLPVAAPPGLLLEAKSRSIGATVTELGKMMGLPMELLLSTLSPGTLRTDAGLGAVVLVSERTGDGLLPPLAVAFSVPVTDAGAFSQALEQDKGRWKPRGVGFVLRQGPLEGLFCKPVVALGDATTRAVCGPSEEDVGEVAPYLTRGLPLADLGSGDLRLRVRFAPLKPRLSSPLEELKQQQSDLLSGGGALLLGGLIDPSLVLAPGAVLEEASRFLEAQESVTLGVQLNGSAWAVEVTGTWTFAPSRDSWLVRLVTSRPERGPAPEVFWRLPRESEVALFGRGVDGEMQDEPRRVVRRVIGALLEERLGLTDAERKPLDDALASLPRGDTPWALGAGGRGQGAWWVLGSEGDGTLFPSWLRRSGRALKQLAALGQRSGRQAWKDATVGLRVEESPAGFPSGSVLIETNATMVPELASGLLPWSVGATGVGEKPERWVLVATPEGKGRSWLGVASDRASLKARMRQVTGRSGKDLLGAEEGLEALRSGKNGFGGRLLVGKALQQGLARFGLAAGEGQGEVPVVLQGGVEAGKIEGKATVPGVLLGALLGATLLGGR
ncbi:MAG: hypothetical protein NZX77_17870 [Polyangiaceae bacterium]|nr:hypothetical protein [Polyangiaceae bacterium]